MLIGIDLGTTNSAVAIWRDGEATLVPNALGELLTSSAVSIEKSGQAWIGRSALDRLANQPQDTASSFKRLMGTPAPRGWAGRTTGRRTCPRWYSARW
ncbi:Hsp70 family protein [Novosphingobium sp. ST904]|uniref:Hsp70 family protein n=1 Tax=Novosphingobium sp. ST904 TaxID=1684385 RepID=UPI000AD0C835|nr:Hsp70 family protein [Novosphingobium sp. ST904]